LDVDLDLRQAPKKGKGKVDGVENLDLSSIRWCASG
jgi:hypothetical protein